MGKKIPLLISTLAFLSIGLFVNTPAQAGSISDDYWELSEVISFKEDIKNEVIAYCAEDDDMFCTDMYYNELRWRDSKGQAVGSLQKFLITSVSPKEGKLSYIYFNDDEWSMFDPSAPRYDLSQLYIGWFPDMSSINYGSMWDYANHTISSEANLLINDSNFTGPGQEIRRHTMGGGFEDNPTNEIYYYAIFEGGSNHTDPAYYGNCLSASPYENTECRLMFRKNNGERVYVPFEIISEEPEVIDEPEDLVESEEPEIPDTPAELEELVEPEIPEEPIISEEPVELEDPIDSNEPEEPVAIEPASESEPEPTAEPEEDNSTVEPETAEESNSTVPTTPDTGVAKEASLKCEKAIEFPWWITLLVAAGETLVIWWFAPTRKSLKKSKNL